MKSVDKGKVFGNLLTDLSKAFDCLEHELLTAKFKAYRFNFPVLHLVIIENTSSSRVEIVFGVPIISILGSLLVNIF